MADIELDRIDWLLLAELQRNGRLTNAELAERVHLSASACLRRVQRLERDGTIAGYRAEVDAERIGLGLQAFVRVQLVHHDAESVAAFARFVNDWDEVVACHALTGDMDYLLQVAVRDGGWAIDALIADLRCFCGSGFSRELFWRHAERSEGPVFLLEASKQAGPSLRSG